MIDRDIVLNLYCLKSKNIKQSMAYVIKNQKMIKIIII